MTYALAGKSIWIAGHSGLVGSALVRRLASENCRIISPKLRIDLRRQQAVEAFLAQTRPQAIVIAAAKVGGILANQTQPADFLYDNLMIQANIVASAHAHGVEKLLLLGSSCIYPKYATQPITEDALLTGPLEPTNQAYAIAKIAGIHLVQAHRHQHGADYIAAMPTNLYGPGDNFDLSTAHVLPALIRKAHEAKLTGQRHLEIWGSGRPRREFLHVDDCADALVFLLKQYSASEPINVGSGQDLSILALAELVADVVGFSGEIVCDRTKPDGTPRKLLNVTKLAALGWWPRTSLRDGILQTYDWYLRQDAAVPA